MTNPRHNHLRALQRRADYLRDVLIPRSESAGHVTARFQRAELEALTSVLAAPPRPAKPVAVEHCGHCPFAWDGTDLGDCWRCTAVDLVDRFRAIRHVQTPAGEWAPPPRWCPLRKADHLVTLRVP